MTDLIIRPLQSNDREWVASFVIEHWGADIVVGHGTIYHPHELPGLVAMLGDEKVGLVTYMIDPANASCEIVTIDSLRQGHGIGSALIDAVKAAANEAGCKRLWLITTNDNLNALRFYQKRGFELVAVHRNALKESRKLKPSIAFIGADGIPLRDEIELEMMLDD